MSTLDLFLPNGLELVLRDFQIISIASNLRARDLDALIANEMSELGKNSLTFVLMSGRINALVLVRVWNLFGLY